MAKKISTDADTTLRAYKFRLDPTQAQKIALAQCAGAARYAYNLLTAHNLDVSRARADYWHARAAQAQLDAKSKAEVELLLLQARTALNPSIDVQVALNDLQARFPNDELINEAVHLNSNTE